MTHINISLRAVLYFAIAFLGPSAESGTPVTEARANDLVAHESFAPASVLFESLLSTNPDNIAARSRLALCLYSLRRDEEARANLARVLERAPDDQTCLYVRYRLEQYEQTPAENVARLRKLISLQPSAESYAIELAQWLIRSGKIKEARDLISQAKEKLVKWRIVHAEAELLEAENRPDEAIALLVQEITKGTKDLLVLYNYARLVTSKQSSSPEQLREALRAINDFFQVARQPKDWPVEESYVYLIAGNAYASQGDVDSAVAMGQEAIKRYNTKLRISPDELRNALRDFQKGSRFIKSKWP